MKKVVYLSDLIICYCMHQVIRVVTDDRIQRHKINGRPLTGKAIHN